VVFRLKGVVESNNKGMVAGSQNLLLGEGTLDLVALDHFLLAQHYTVLALSCMHRLHLAPFMAYSRLDFFSRTK
jgi:hypothetical protein